ncbi:LPXTG cell wall anchor domain-containing protein [Micromonospora sp. NPDC050276]
MTGTGTTTLAGLGAALLLLGGAGYLIARRRRTRFVA